METWSTVGEGEGETDRVSSPKENIRAQLENLFGADTGRLS